MSATSRTAVEFILSEGQLHDAPQGRLLMDAVVMDRAYEDDYTRYIAQTLNFKPIVPPKKNRKDPWDYDIALYKRRNEIEGLFRLIKGFRRIFSRFEKLDIMFSGFIQLALIFVSIR